MLRKQLSSFILIAGMGITVVGCDEEPQYEHLERVTIQPTLAIVSDWTLDPRLGVIAMGADGDGPSWLSSMEGFTFRWGDLVVADVAVVPPPARVQDARATYRLIREISRTRVPSGYQYSLCLSSCLVEYSEGDRAATIGRGIHVFDAEVGAHANDMALIATTDSQARVTFEMLRSEDEVTHVVVSVALGGEEQLSDCPFICYSSASAP